ncbi:hypothetical protein ASPWEDRAFT_181455 [Aspergillus wentii DTO 134E9]|uniref:Uncharacterized protein n=1 Tax=Aspergillus wentii DTO 134E9 TaxID=1073089 RepID=A0A1L9RNN1_ASPWE|nr:uncharacterized protein ASPWEDRAFT_181455 [Aspergillus wentii DTO 134E9]OJJ36448.1 hypothetical protein ASPWEDRAFT_181455 [Aspergillus wentii DTO 134E9]
MADSFGERLLAEVHEETLDELLRDLRSHCYATSDNASRYRLGVRELDELLEVFMPMSTAAQAQHQPSLHQTQPPGQQPSIQQDYAEDQHPQSDGHEENDQHEATADTSPAGPPTRVNRVDPVVEISSTSSAAGKSQLLYYLAAVAVLPSTYDGMRLDGREAAIVFIDADGRFDADRLRTVARGIVRQKLKTQKENSTPTTETENASSERSPEEIETIIVTSLQHVHMLRPQSSSSLLSTLQKLETYLFDLPRHFSSNRPLHAILIDSASAFFWQDKLRDEVARIEDIGRPPAEVERERSQKQSFYLLDVYVDLVKELKRLQRQFSCVVVYTTIAWSGKSVGGPGHGQPHNPSGPFDLYVPPVPSVPKTPSFRSSLPAPWGTFPTLRLVVQRDVVRPFPPLMTPHEAQRDATMRQEMVVQGRFSGWVNGWGREDWPRRVTEGIEWRNNGMFTFNITRSGVDIPATR